MDDATWDSVLQSMTGQEPPAADSVIETPAPSEDAPLANATDSSAAQESTADALPVASDAASVSETTPAAPPPLDWDHPELRAFRETAERDAADAEVLRRTRATLAEQQRIQQSRNDQQLIADLADGDAERQQQITGLLARYTTPLQQRAQAEAQRAHGAEKQTAAFLIAMKAELSEEQFAPIFQRYEALMELEGPEVMERVAYSDRDAKRAWSQKEAALMAKINELETRLSAHNELAQRGNADVVDGGTGVSADALSRDERMANATNFGDFFNAMMGRSAAA